MPPFPLTASPGTAVPFPRYMNCNNLDYFLKNVISIIALEQPVR
jgi:hypothetical protein